MLTSHHGSPEKKSSPKKVTGSPGKTSAANKNKEDPSKPGFHELAQADPSYRHQVYSSIDALYLAVHLPPASLTGNARAMAIYLNEQNLDGLPIQDVLGQIENELVKVTEEFDAHLKRADKDYMFKMRLKQYMRNIDGKRKDKKASEAMQREKLETEKRH